jgi:Fe-S-cluster-containing dehydrogenase component
MSKYMIRHDPNRCISCKACEVHCQVRNRTAPGVRPGHLITVGPVRVEGKIQTFSAFRPCFHCEKPWCVAVCPTKALAKREEDGVVLLDRGLCVGCRACVEACPWRVPQWDESTGKVVKCDGCMDRVELGLKPACVTGCSTRALSFSRPNERVREARLRYAKSCLVKETKESKE